MSHSLPVAPPLPTPLHNDQRSTTPTKSRIDECLWAKDFPELQMACFLARVCAVQPPRKCQYHNIASIIQTGPTCGLTALSMLLRGAPAPQQLLDSAKELHYTNNGEMFSAQNLFQLICDNLKIIPVNATTTGDAKTSRDLIECQMHEGHLNCAKIREKLMTGACIFVPYDPDFNHAPCLRFGHKSHWALIVGYLISERDEFYVLARHGKAKNLAVWSLEALSESNSNLIEFVQPKGYPDCDFLLPPGGIGGDLGLRERAIVVRGLPLDTINVR